MNKADENKYDARIEQLVCKTAKALKPNNSRLDSIDKVDASLKMLGKLKKEIYDLISELEVEHFLEYGSQMEQCPELV